MRRHRIHHIGSVHVADSASSGSAARSNKEQTCARGVAAPMVPLFCCSELFACGALTAHCVAISGVRLNVHRGAEAALQVSDAWPQLSSTMARFIRRRACVST